VCRKRNANGAVYDAPRVAVAAGRFDEVVRRGLAEDECRVRKVCVPGFIAAKIGWIYFSFRENLGALIC